MQPTLVYLTESKRYINLANVTAIITRKTDTGSGFTLWLVNDGSNAVFGNECDVDGSPDVDTLTRALRQFTINSHEVKE